MSVLEGKPGEALSRVQAVRHVVLAFFTLVESNLWFRHMYQRWFATGVSCIYVC